MTSNQSSFFQQSQMITAPDPFNTTQPFQQNSTNDPFNTTPLMITQGNNSGPSDVGQPTPLLDSGPMIPQDGHNISGDPFMTTSHSTAMQAYASNTSNPFGGAQHQQQSVIKQQSSSTINSTNDAFALSTSTPQQQQQSFIKQQSFSTSMGQAADPFALSASARQKQQLPASLSSSASFVGLPPNNDPFQMPQQQPMLQHSQSSSSQRQAVSQPVDPFGTLSRGNSFQTPANAMGAPSTQTSLVPVKAPSASSMPLPSNPFGASSGGLGGPTSNQAFAGFPTQHSTPMVRFSVFFAILHDQHCF